MPDLSDMLLSYLTVAFIKFLGFSAYVQKGNFLFSVSCLRSLLYPRPNSKLHAQRSSNTAINGSYILITNFDALIIIYS